jgi:phytanoyl-CoA hydroxylase
MLSALGRRAAAHSCRPFSCAYYSHLSAELDTNGYAIVKNVISKQLVAEANAHVDWLLERNPEVRPEHLHYPLMWTDPFWLRLVSDPSLVAVAENALGNPSSKGYGLCIFASHYIVKPPHDGLPVLWHQDRSYFPVEPTDSNIPVGPVTLWLALNEVNAENGCMQVVRSSHKDHARLLPFGTRTDVPNALNTSIHEEALQVDEADVVNLELQPGDVSMHHLDVIHGSQPNHSDKWRKGIAIRYMPTSTLMPDKLGDMRLNLFLVNGKAKEDVNSYRKWPPYEGAPAHMEFEGRDKYIMRTGVEWMDEGEMHDMSARQERWFEQKMSLVERKPAQKNFFTDFMDTLVGK